jgi:hypothetical protein
MTPQEQDMIGDLIDRVQKTQLAEKDPDAEQMLQQGLGRTPDALYILAQTVLVQKYALEQAQTQLAQAKEQIQQLQQHPEPKHATSFLGNLLGLNREQQEPAPPPPQARPQSYAPPPPPPPPPYAPVGYGPNPAGPYAGGPGYGAPPMGMPGSGGFLQNAMQTAAGVAAGALAFEGVESLMHGFGHAAGYGGGSGLGGFGGAEERPTETITNNYYDGNRGGQGDQGSHDVTSAERTLGDSENYSASDKDTGSRDSLYGANDTTTADSSASAGNTSLDDSSADDSSDDSSNDGGNDFDDSSSGFDEGGGGDDSGF